MEVDTDQITVESTAQLIAKSLGAEIQEEGDEYRFTNEFIEEHDLNMSISADKLSGILKSLRVKYKIEGGSIHTDHRFETLVREKSLYGPSVLGRHGEVSQRDTVNDISYSIGLPSFEYAIFLLNKISSEDELESLARLKYWRFVTSSKIRRGREDSITLPNVIKNFIPSFVTLKIASQKNRSLSVFNKFADSALFQLSYNLDVAIVQQRSIEEIVRTGRIRRNRRNEVKDIEAPRRHFESDLVHHYQMGVSASNPSLAYLSYYHICEHFFDSIFEDDLINDLQNLITQPDFSYRRKRDIQSIIKEVKNSFISRGDDFSYNENYALKLTLRKLVDLGYLKKKVEDYDPLLIEHYKINKVDFADGVPVNLENEDSDSELGTMATRIYRTRNAIVHSKGGANDRYIPFKHDHILVKEVPLIRFIAEIIIYETSSLIRQ